MLKVLKYRLLHASDEGGEQHGSDSGTRPDPEAVRAARNNSRLSRMQEIADGADARRSSEMMDVDGQRVVGRFQNGEFDDTPEALARAAQLEQHASYCEPRRLEEEDAEREEARRLQEDGATQEEGEGADSRGRTREAEPEGDEKVVDGVRYYRCIVGGQERWLTLKQLRESASASAQAEQTLQQAQEALRSAAQAELTPKEAPVEVPEEVLENVILSASLGDEEAVKKLASVISGRPKGINPQDIARQVSQQIATQRLVDRAEATQSDLLDNEVLAPIFRQRLRAFAESKPNTRIDDAYKAVGEQMRKDFAPMISEESASRQAQPALRRHPESKADRKRTIVNPPQSAGRKPPAPSDEDREVPVSEQIDAIARARGQQRAHRIRRQ